MDSFSLTYHRRCWHMFVWYVVYLTMRIKTGAQIFEILILKFLANFWNFTFALSLWTPARTTLSNVGAADRGRHWAQRQRRLGGSHMTASLGGCHDPWSVKHSTDWLTDLVSAPAAAPCLYWQASLVVNFTVWKFVTAGVMCVVNSEHIYRWVVELLSSYNSILIDSHSFVHL